MSIYMQYPNSTGSVTASNFKNWVHIDDVFHGVNRGMRPTEAGRGNDRDRGNSHFHHVEITKPIDQSSAKIYQDCVTGKVVPQIKISVVKTDNDLSAYLEYTLHNVFVSSIDKHIKGETPFEVIHFSFSKIEERYTPHDATNKAQSPINIGYNAETAEVM